MKKIQNSLDKKLQRVVDSELIWINEKLQKEIADRETIEAHGQQLLTELERSNKELKDFAYIVSHDLKAPLRGISSLATWIVEDYADVLDDEGKENLELLVGRVRRMNNLIDGILRHSRVGLVKIFLESLDSKSIVQDVVSVLDIPDNMIMTIDENLPVIIYDETHLIQVCGNLIGNTLIHVEKPEIKVHIGCENLKDYWKFYVRDNGEGIKKTYSEKIFQIFQTLKPRDEKETTGIGLSLVKKIVELHQGRVWMESVIGEGTTFYFTIPKNYKALIA